MALLMSGLDVRIILGGLGGGSRAYIVSKLLYIVLIYIFRKMNKINFNIIVLSSVIRRVFIIPLCNILFKISSIICIPRASSCNNINNNNNYYYLPAYFKRFIIHVLHINK